MRNRARFQKLVDRLEAKAPDAVRLAECICIAARIEPELLRAMRLGFLPGVEAGVEADLWFSPLAQSQTSLALVLLPGVVDILRERMAEPGNRIRLDAAWDILRRVHVNAPSAIKVEEEVTWLALSKGKEAIEQIEKLLRSVTVAMDKSVERRYSLALWAARALPRLPEVVWQTEGAMELELRALVLRASRPDPDPEGTASENWREAFGLTQVGVRLVEGGVEIGDPMLQGAHAIRVPNTVPVPLKLEWRADRQPRSELVTWRPGRTRRVAGPPGEVRIRTLLSEVFTLRPSEIPRSFETPIRILHLSDLHFTGETPVRARLQSLLDDVHKGEALRFETLDHLVITGDITDRGSTEGLETAREFVTLLIETFGLSAQRCIFVPGNHDVQDLLTSYEWRSTAAGLKPDQYVRAGSIFLVRNEKGYPLRLKQFSEGFFHKILQQPYPLDAAQQGMAYLFPETRLQFLALNSSWKIDQFHRNRAGVQPEAVAHVIEQANRQVAQAIAREELEPGAKILRLGVWHHAVAGQEMMENSDFVGHLQNNGVRLGLHGHVHELRRELVAYRNPRTRMYIVGAGSFASPAEGRPESTPRLYNLLEVRRDLSSVRVHTRVQPRPDGPWQGWYAWPAPDGEARGLPYYDIDLTWREKVEEL